MKKLKLPLVIGLITLGVLLWQKDIARSLTEKLQTTTNVYAATANSWNIKRDTSDANKLKFSYDTSTETPLTITTDGKTEVRGYCGTTDCRQFNVTYPNGGGLAGTEFSALAYPSSDGYNTWTAMYAKQGSASYAGLFKGTVGIYPTNTWQTWGEAIKLNLGSIIRWGDAGFGYTTDGWYWRDNTSWKMHLSNGGNLTVTGTYSPSDERLKKNLEPLQGVLPKIENIRAVKFDWDKSKSSQSNLDSDRQIGLIAQDVKKSFPELVKTSADGYQSLSYDKFSAVLLEAIKEQQKEIEILQKQVRQLQQK